MTRARPPGPRSPRASAAGRTSAPKRPAAPTEARRTTTSRRPSTFEREGRRTETSATPALARVRLARPTTAEDVAALSRALGDQGTRSLSALVEARQRAAGLVADGVPGPALLRLVGASNRDQLPGSVVEVLGQVAEPSVTRPSLSPRARALAEALSAVGPGLTLALDANAVGGEPAVASLRAGGPSAVSFDTAATRVLGELRAPGLAGAEGHATTALRFFVGA